MTSQVELNRKRDADFQKLQRELEESHSQNDVLQVTFRKKHQDGINQLTEQIEQLQKLKQKSADAVKNGSLPV